MTEDEKKVYGCLALVAAMPFTWATHALLQGWMLSWSWNRFAVQLGAPRITTALAIGLAVMLAMTTKQIIPTPRHEPMSAVWSRLVAGYIYLGFLWITAAIAWQFVKQ